MGLDLHVRQILEKELDIISGRKVVCLCCFHNAVDHCAGFCAGRRVAEQPVLSADCKGVDPAAKTVLEIVENFSLENNALNGLCCLRLVYRKTLQQPPEFLPAQAPHLCFCSWPLKAARLYTLVK